jgi:hypothetical protein
MFPPLVYIQQGHLRRAGVFQPLAAGSEAVLMHGLKCHIRSLERIGSHKSLNPNRRTPGSGCLGGVLDAL